MRAYLPQDRDSSGLDSKMTPMIDVIFQLQIFFLATAGFAVPEALLPAELPTAPEPVAKAEAAAGTEPKQVEDPFDLDLESEDVEIVLRGAGPELAIRLDDRRLTSRDELAASLRRLADVTAEFPVRLDIGDEVWLEDVVFAYDACLLVGIRNIAFVTGPAPPEDDRGSENGP